MLMGWGGAGQGGVVIQDECLCYFISIFLMVVDKIHGSLIQILCFVASVLVYVCACIC